MARGFTIEPEGPFSLQLAAGFGFGPRSGEDDERILRLAFAVDGLREHAGVVVRQHPDGTLRAEVDSDADAGIVRRQVARILSLDHDGGAWLEVGERDRVIGRLQQLSPGLRPVLFHSPYEAAGWAIVSARQRRQQAVRVRDRIAQESGRSFELAGRCLHAFPLPGALVEIEYGGGLSAAKATRLRALAGRAERGELEAARLKALGPERARANLIELEGIGPFYASLIVVRACGFADVLADEPRLRESVAHYYGLDRPPSHDELEAIAEPWRPYRTWASVLLRYAATREGLVKK